MPFQKKPDNLRLKRQLNCTISEDMWERWHLICQRNNTTSHELLRQVVENYINQKGTAYGVLDLWKGTTR